jgi:hypothetical protein
MALDSSSAPPKIDDRAELLTNFSTSNKYKNALRQRLPALPDRSRKLRAGTMPSSSQGSCKK